MTVVVGYVPTPLGRTAVRVAAEEAARRGRPLLIVNSATGGAYADSGLAPAEELENLANDARSFDITVEVKQVQGALSVAETLLEEVSSAGVELLVIGMRTRSRTGKFLLGSTAQTVLLRSPCHVLAVKDLDAT